MAANLSARKRASLVLTLPAVQLAGSFLCVTCTCGRSAWLHTSDLATHGRTLTLAEGIRRLRCGECGLAPIRVVLAARYPPRRGDEAGWLRVWE
ncbi:MAG: hypothetical protein ACRYHQ_28330 [Janthinobacterium lividum]